MKKYKALGMMSGSSFDGLDLAFCEFTEEHSRWQYAITAAETLPYPEEWKMLLHESFAAGGLKLIENHIAYGKYLGQQAKKFLEKYRLTPDIIASHGHTIFHQPQNGFSFQLGDGQALATASGVETVSDFRNKDIQLGGQGAPLVPIGDKLLFSEYDACFNFGGIANISFDKNGKRVAYDVCPANQLLNHLSRQMGEPYDKDGRIASLGKMDKALFDALNNADFYKKSYPKSLSNEEVQQFFIPLLDHSEASLEDKLFTAVKHIAFHVARAAGNTSGKKMLLTGGGARNGFLVEAIRMENPEKEVYIPDLLLIDFKEALIFALMGVLRKNGQINCLASSTGASADSSTGVIYQP
jgi:anhydro-N-acetylmuramic acid kinase